MLRRFVYTLIVFPLCASLSAQNESQEEIEMAMRKTNMAIAAIKALYVDSVDVLDLSDEGIRGMLSSLDPHSAYSTAEETKKLNEPLNGNFEGIGVQFNILEDTVLVIQTVSKGPSEKAGILPGDRIVACNDTVIAGVKMDRADIMKHLRGDRGTLARLTIKRPGVDGLLSFDVVRDKIPLYTLDASYIIRPGIGYIRISSFGLTTESELRTALRELKEEGMESLILDLQDNGGGYLQAGTAVASQFLKKGELIVYTDGRAVPYQEYRADSGGLFTEGRLVVLVDALSASAAEIVSGAIQDQDRGVIVGLRTFGKGLVQRPVELPDGSMIRLTVSHYYTPAGRCIQKPYEKGKASDYVDDLNQRYKEGEMMHQDSVHLVDSLRVTTLKRGRSVYGGGGIMPDYFVPLDTTKYTSLYRKLSSKNLILQNYMRYADSERNSLKSLYPDFEQFKATYEVPQSLTDKILSDGHEAGINPKDDEELDATLTTLRRVLKGLTARDLWDMSEYYSIINEAQTPVQRALQIISGEEYDRLLQGGSSVVVSTEAAE